MNKTQLRKKRKKVKKERLEILRQIDKLQYSLNRNTDKEECNRLQGEISRLGELLQKKVTVNIADHCYTKSKDKFQELGKTLTKKSAWSMSYDQYIKMKKCGISDERIAIEMGATIGQLISWKHKYGITRNHWKEAN